jgi:phosphoribosylamine--glycine ligase
MKILFISHDLIAGNIAYKMKQEGNEVKIYIENPDGKKNFDQMLTKTDDWRSELQWVGKEDGLIVFDDVGYGKVQEKLREEGYAVFGGSELGDRLEIDREYGQEILRQCGIKTVELRDFVDVRSAIEHIKKNPKVWVVKQNNHSIKNLTYTGIFEDGRDVINVLENYEKNGILNSKVITLQESVKGVEMGIGRFFNGSDWVGPIEINFEHTRFFPGDLGPITSEMGTLAWYDDNEKNKLFQETIAKLKPYLQKINYRGDIGINCIVNEDGATPLEATSRLGTPIVHLQSEIHQSPWSEFLYAVASGKKYNLKWKKGYGIVVMLAVPPFPYTYKMEKYSSFDTNIYFSDKIKAKDIEEHMHFEEVSLRPYTNDQFYISDSRGYIMYVTGIGETVELTQSQVYKIIKEISIPKMFYRNDIGSKFSCTDCDKLVKWGYLSEEGGRVVLHNKDSKKTTTEVASK